jgi:hypothetical protein
MPDNPYKFTSWTPMAGVSRLWLDEIPLGTEVKRSAHTGARNGLDGVGFVPYHWNTGERLRRAVVAAQLREARQHALEAIQRRPDADTDPYAVAIVVARYGLQL